MLCTLRQSSTFQKTLLHLWKSCMLIQATQYIRYILPNQPDSQNTNSTSEITEATRNFQLPWPANKFPMWPRNTGSHRLLTQGVNKTSPQICQRDTSSTPGSIVVKRNFAQHMFQPRSLTWIDIEYHMSESNKHVPKMETRITSPRTLLHSWSCGIYLMTEKSICKEFEQNSIRSKEDQYSSWVPGSSPILNETRCSYLIKTWW